ncbi:hypothetical protein GW17_00030546 [Ensete ventricosum]|nr:hypothetical protein GW17_00030546 [Ensete ventricosum]
MACCGFRSACPPWEFHGLGNFSPSRNACTWFCRASPLPEYAITEDKPGDFAAVMGTEGGRCIHGEHRHTSGGNDGTLSTAGSFVTRTGVLEGSHFALEKEEEVVDLKPSFRGCRTDGQRDREFGWRKWNVEGNRGSAARYPFDCLRLGSPRKELLA